MSRYVRLYTHPSSFCEAKIAQAIYYDAGRLVTCQSVMDGLGGFSKVQTLQHELIWV